MLALLGSVLAPAATLGVGAGNYSPHVGQDHPSLLLWGDTHLHTDMSPDAATLGNRRITPETAYRFARGEVVQGMNGMPIRISRPLDFLVIADHSEYLGLFPRLEAGDENLMATEVGKRWASYISTGAVNQAFIEEWVHSLGAGRDVIGSPAFTRSVWDEVIANAERFNVPGQFSALIGYEWSSMPAGDNLHRVVVFGDDADKVASVLPFTAIDSSDPEQLWAYLADYESRIGGQALAIPHNSNTSGGRMFEPVDFAGAPIDSDYAQRRQRWEPVIEVTQYKGDSETHPLLSPSDEFADYETWDMANIGSVSMQTDAMQPFQYARSALKLGLAHEAATGVNPFRFGMLGSTDSHTGFATAEEDNFWGKMSRSEPSPTRWSQPLLRHENKPEFEIPEWKMAASGYAAVWARANTRQEIVAAMKRREVYATTGTRIKLRVFAGAGFTREDAYKPDLARVGYAGGVPMGGVLQRIADGAPRFLVHAARDEQGANLDRVQMIKGWLDRDGKLQERVFDIAVSDGRGIDSDGRATTSVQSSVDLASASYSNRVGAGEFIVFWQDPEFAADSRAFYYVRVLEIPTPRWTAHDRVFFDIAMDPEVPQVHQERAYSSPIWYLP
jgi:hypothetical protein